MSRKLEKFIGDNRNEFDDAVPSNKVWENIAGNVEQKKKTNAVITPFYKWSIAAAILIIASITVLLVFNKKAAPENIVETKKDAAELNDIAPEYAPEVNEFAKLVAIKQEELKALAPEQPALYQKFATDINQLDSSYKSLKKQLNTSPNREMLIEAMIQNLQLQLQVLNQQLNIINQIKQSKKDSHEKKSIYS